MRERVAELEEVGRGSPCLHLKVALTSFMQELRAADALLKVLFSAHADIIGPVDQPFCPGLPYTQSRSVRIFTNASRGMMFSPYVP